MPIYEIKCLDCDYSGELLVLSPGEKLVCPSCGGSHTERLLSAPSGLTGKERQQFPGPGDHGCCGSSPDKAGCAGPGSCCGKNF
jgi:putative FmdB family regulatory protein